MTDPETVKVLQTSRDARELKKAAELLASSGDPLDHEVLGRYLSSAEFLGRLDAADDYRKTYAALRLTPVMETLTENRLPSTDRVLLDLIASPDYQSERLRRVLLVRALSVVSPSPPEAVKYWEEKSRPGSPLASYVVESLCANQSDPALELLTRIFADPGHEEDLKAFWMHEQIMPRRNDLPLLSWSERMLSGPLPKGLKPVLVESLCANQSEPALELLTRIVADPGHEEDLKAFWMYEQIMPRRNDLPLVAWCEKMFSGPLPEELKPALVESLYDYRPESWFRDCDPPKPPPRSLAEEPVKTILRRMGEKALKTLPLAEAQKRPVRSVLIELGKDEKDPGKG